MKCFRTEKRRGEEEGERRVGKGGSNLSRTVTLVLSHSVSTMYVIIADFT